MNKSIIIGITFFITTALQGQNQNEKSMEQQDSGLDEQILIYLNSLYIQSYIHSDTETYDKLLWAEEFTQENPDGKIYSRAEMMTIFGRPRFDTIVYMYAKDVRVEFLSDDKAVVSATNPDCFLIEGKMVKGISTYKDTYVKRNGKWKCISAVIKNAEE